MNFSSKYIYAFLVTSLLIACDNVKDDERLIPLPKTEVKRNVLIQEFTGQRCPNCPEGAAVVHDIIESNEEGSVVAVSLHPSGIAFTRPLDGFNFTCETATEYYNYYKPNGLPSAVIDGASPVENTATWDAIVSQDISRTTPVEISANPSFDPSTRIATVDYSLLFNEMVNTPMNINVWLVENNIVAPQISNGSKIPDYVHNHVLRGSFTGTWGNYVGESFLYSQTIGGTLSLEIDPDWVAENCSVVVFMQNPSTKFVYQVIQVDLPNK